MLSHRAFSSLRTISCIQKKTSRWSLRTLTSAAHDDQKLSPARSWLYVPSSSDRMLEKSLSNPSDMIIYDLEDSVPPSVEDKNTARDRLSSFLLSKPEAELPRPERIAVRLNAVDTPHFERDIAEVIRLPCVRTLVLPKVHGPGTLQQVFHKVNELLERPLGLGETPQRKDPLRLVASIESARSLFHIREIAQWHLHETRSSTRLTALLFAAEDFCADTSVIRTASRQELLYTRSKIALTAKACRLQAIDMVCVNYKDLAYLKEECEDGRRLGFDGKQAIHPTQVDIIHSTFVPTEKEILRAARIVRAMEKAHLAQKGAIGLELEGGGKEMIDAPMIKQAENIVRIAKSAGLTVPEVD